MEQSPAVKHSKEIERSSEKESSSGKEGSSRNECCSASKSNGGKKSHVQFKATRHVKKQKMIFFIKSRHNYNFWAKLLFNNRLF